MGGIFVSATRSAGHSASSPRADRQLGYLFGTEGWATGGITMGMVLCVPMALVGLGAIVLALRGATRPRGAVEGTASPPSAKADAA